MSHGATGCGGASSREALDEDIRRWQARLNRLQQRLVAVSREAHPERHGHASIGHERRLPQQGC